MSNFSDIKKRLSMSTTMPAGTGGAPAQWLMGSVASHHHVHAEDGSCCGHDHAHDHHHEHAHAHHHAHDDDDEEECDEDHTNPSGGCGCC